MNARPLSVVCLALSLVACKSSFDSEDDSEASTTQSDDTNAGDGDSGSEASSSDSSTGDETSTGDDSTTTGGDGDDSTTGGDGDDSTTGDGDDSTTGDGDGATTGDGDGDGDYCNGNTELSFNDPFDRNVGASLIQLVAGDYIGDGTTDIIGAASSASFFVTMRNNGGGGNFPDSQITNVDVGSATVEYVNLGPLDAGDKLDVLVVTDQGMRIQLGSDNEMLNSPINISPATSGSVNYHAGAIADIGGMSGRGDIIVQRQNQGTEEVIVYDGATFETATMPDYSVAIGTPDSARHMLTGRFNNDNEEDVLMLIHSDTDGTFSTMMNSTGGGLGFDATTNITTLDANTAADAADMDLDGHVDLVVSEGGAFGDLPENVNIFWGSENGFSNSDKTTIEVGDLLGFPAIADFNCDGNRDFAIAVAGEGRIAFYMGDGARNFAFDSDITLAQSGPYAMVAEDFNGDGAPDVAVSVPMLERVLIYNQMQ